MPRLSAEEQKKGQERGKQYTSISGVELSRAQDQANRRNPPPQQYQQEFQPTPENAKQDWKYQNATIDMQGRPLPAGAKGFDPLGRPYFGPGLPGTLKRYAYQLMGEPSSGLGAENWKEIVNIGRDISTENVGELAKRVGAGLFGLDVEKTTANDKQKVAELDQQIQDLAKAKGLVGQPQATADPEIKALMARKLELTGKNIEGSSVIEVGGQNISLLTPVVRSSKVGIAALFDILSEFSVKTEQAAGAYRAIEEVAGGPGNQWIDTHNKLADGALRGLFPYIEAASIAYNFFEAPLSFDKKAELVAKGWDEGRLLYTEIAEPAIREEYIRRAESGEDPQLLAMELQNPWAELTGQLILDPLNVVGMLAKGAKVANKIDDVGKIVKSSGLAEDAAFLDKINDLNHASSDADALRKIDDLAGVVQDFFFTKADDVLTPKQLRPQSYKPLALSAEGNRMRAARDMGNVITWGVGNVYREGKNIDDVHDWLTGLVKLSSDNLDEVRQGIAALTHFPSAKTNFGESFLETSRMIRNILTKEDGVMDYNKILKKIEGANGDWDALAVTMKGIIDDATKAQFPTVSEMKKAADVAEQARLTGKVVPEKTKQLAQTFSELQKTNPGVIRIAEFNEVASKPKNFLNGILGKFYFSYQYGVGARNMIQNNLITLIDAGPKAWFREGKFWSEGAITDELLKWHSGQLPPAVAGFKTLPGSVGATSDKLFGILPSGSALMEKGEISAAKRVYYKFFRDTIDNMIKPGVGLPSMNEFKAVGMTETQVKHFTQMVKHNYGDVKGAMKQFDELYKNGGPDMWRMLDDYASPQQVSALKDAGMYDEIIEFTRRTDATREDVSKFFAGMRNELKTRAGSIVDDLPGHAPDRPLSEELSNVVARAGKYFTDADGAKLDTILEASYQAHDKYIASLTEIAQKTGDPELVGVLGDLAKRTPDNEIRKITRGITENAWDITRKSRKSNANLTQLWAQSGVPGPVPASAEELRKAVWNYTKQEKIPLEWTNYFDRTFEVSENVAQRFGTTDLLREARTLMSELQEYRTATYTDDLKILKKASKTQQLAKNYGVAEKHLDNIVRKFLRGEYTGEVVEGVKEFEKLSEVPDDVVRQALRSRLTAGEGNIPEGMELADFLKILDENPDEPVKASLQAWGEQIPPPYIDGAMPVPSRAFAENGKGLLETIDNVERQMLQNWGLKAADAYDSNMSKAMRTIAATAGDRMAEGRLIAQKVGEYWRDFALLPYGETTHLDHAMSYVFPYQFWYSRSYKTWMQRLASDPQIIAGYAKLKDKMAQAHKEAPEWWRYNVSFPDFLGANNGNPMFVNLEAALWPMYGLTGTDFNDPYKRTNWFTATVDDLGKFGPSMFAPAQWAIAAGLSLTGEKEAAARWAGRAIPQTATIKSLMSVAGLTPAELDPAVQIFNGSGLFDTSAMDTYERNRVGRALSAMVQEGVISEEQALDVARVQEGEVWDEALLRATQLRAPGQISSFFAGVGFKARTPEDMEIDSFYADYGRLQNLNKGGFISPEDYKKSWDVLRERYPFMDTVLLSRRAGDERESAYAYNVLGRIPPGQSKEVYELVGVDGDLAAKFYESGGKFEGWKETDKQKFLAGMVEAGALLAIPPYANKAEWTDARLEYKDMQAKLKNVAGDDILDQIDLYYNIPDRSKAKLYLDTHPEVAQAMDLQQSLIVNTPLLMEYYGGIDTLERYYNGKVYDQLEQKFGKDITTKEQVYFDLRIQEATGEVPRGTAKKYLKSNNLGKYWDEKSELKEQAFGNVVALGAKLPEAPETFYREDAPEIPQMRQPVDWTAALGGPTVELIQMSYLEGDDLPRVVQSELEYQAGRYGYDDPNDMLRDILIDLQR